MPNGTGDTLATTSKRCGECCKPRRRTTSSSPRANAIRCESSVNWAFQTRRLVHSLARNRVGRARDWSGGRDARRNRSSVFSARRRGAAQGATRPRQEKNSGGGPERPSPNWSTKWSTRTCRRSNGGPVYQFVKAPSARRSRGQSPRFAGYRDTAASLNSTPSPGAVGGSIQPS